jgi:hypothetical protein
MNGEAKKQTADKKGEKVCFECAEEAAALLNCVTDKSYNEMRCLPLLKKLRACVEKKVRLVPHVLWSSRSMLGIHV